jgi:hypothetical protein
MSAGRDLRDLLRRQSAGLHTAEAAVELVIAHGEWIGRADFLEALVEVWDAGEMAAIVWDDVVDFLDEHEASSSAEAILRIAASIAGAPVGGSLADLLTGLDVRNLGLVLEAIAHAGGWHDRGAQSTVTGCLEDTP